MTSYSLLFTPPAPVVEVVVQNPRTRRMRAVLPAILDTGADVSALPALVIERLRLYEMHRMLVAGIDGTLRPVFSFGVHVHIAPDIRIPVEVIPCGHEFVILGRDVLNQLVLRLDGPALSLEIERAGAE
jgi:hypothetical protein